jgi:hypothetical protein
MFTLGVLLHNTEEALYLPAWSNFPGKWYRPIAARTFRIAIVLFSALVLLFTTLAAASDSGSIAAYIMAGYVLAMVLNAACPHALATLVMRRYMPGTATALLLNVPLGLLYLHQALAQHRIDPHTFLWTGPATVLAIVMILPLLFAIGRNL